MAIRDTHLRFLRGIFAALVAFCVVVSASVHTSAAGDHAQAIVLSDGLGLHGDHDASPDKSVQQNGKTSSTKSGKAVGDICKMQCAFSMIMPVERDGVAAYGHEPWEVIPAVASLPGKIAPAQRPPRI